MRAARRRSGKAPTDDRAMSVTAHLAVIIVSGFALGAAGVGYAHHWNQGQAHRAARDGMTFQAQHAAQSTADLIADWRKSVAALAAQEGLQKVLQGAPGCTLSFDPPRGLPSGRLDLVSADGTVACSSGSLRPPARVHAGSPWLVTTLRDGKQHVLTSGRDAITGESALVISAPVVDAARTVHGAAALFFHLGPVADALAATSAGSDDVRFTVVDLVTHAVLSGPDGSRSASVLTRAAALPSSVTTGAVGDSNGSGFDVGSADVPGTSWRVFAGTPSAHVLAGAQGALWRQVLAGLVVLLILTAATWRLDRSVAKPLQALMVATRKATKNLGSDRVVEEGTSETRELGRAFNLMLDVAGGHAAQLSHQANHDALTGLPNKVKLMDCIRRALAVEQPVAVLTLGMNRFRLVNDGLGHDVGDRVLREIAGRLGRVLREGDTLARLGSDEFVVLAPGMSADDALHYAGRLQDSLAEVLRVGQGELSLSAAVGLATGSAPSATAGRLLRESDTALRHAKREGLRLQAFGQHLQTVAQTNLTLERELHQAIIGGELVVHYQPLVDIATGYVVAAEALVRWQHPQRGLIPPVEFVTLAEQTGQVVAIGELVLRGACQQAAAWAAAGDAVVVGVNVAAAQLRTGTFPQLVEQVLTETGLDPRQLCLELTESSLLSTTERRSDDLTRLRALGVHLAIDDFGTGYSSLSYLHDLPCDELKIDRSFVSRLDGGESHLVTAILRMAQAMDLTVVAEGIETQAQLDRLAALGCQLGQGYLFSRPVPAAEFQKLMSRRHAAAGALA